METTDVAIVGAGPIGLELAAGLKRLGVDYRQFEAGSIGQTITWYPKQTRFFSSPERIAIAGVPLQTPDQTKATREQYLTYLRSVVTQFDLAVRTQERVESIERDGDGFILRTRTRRGEHAYRAGRVVVAIGDMHRPKELGIEGEDLPHVSHYFDEPHRYFRERLLVVGGKNSAVETALRCHKAGARVSISYRRSAFDEHAIKYWLLPELKSLIRAGKIGFYPETAPARITRERVELAATGPSGTAQSVEPDFVLLMTGYGMRPELLASAGVTLEGENRQPRHDESTMETDVPGLYVAGTAAAGTQHHFRLFIENAHPHVARICRAITGHVPPGINNPWVPDALAES